MNLSHPPVVFHLRLAGIVRAVGFLAVLLMSSRLALAQGTGEWDGKMSPQAEEHQRMGVAAMAQRDWKTALRELRTALKYTPKAVPVHNAMGEVYLETGEFDKAVVAFRKAIALGPLFAPAYGNMSARRLR